MLFTTFFPTAAHLLIALLALLLPLIPWRESTAERLSERHKDFFSFLEDMVRVVGILLAPPILLAMIIWSVYAIWEWTRNCVKWFVGALQFVATLGVEIVG